MTKLQATLAAIFAFSLGCAASTFTPLLIPPAHADSGEQRWEYFCQNDLYRVWEQRDQAVLNRAGAEGWELVLQVDQNRDVYCFKRPVR